MQGWEFMKRADKNNCKLSANGANAALQGFDIQKKLIYCDTVTSTFDKLKEFEPCEGLTVLAAHQTAGVGRLGRSWKSVEGGIYFSFLLLPPLNTDTVPFITITCAVGVYRALSKYADCKIKWPNDIVCGGRKLCGILSKTNLCGNVVAGVSVGIGINANITDFGSDLPNAISLKLICGREIDENRLFAEVLREIDNTYYHTEQNAILSEYKNACVTLNREVTVHFNGKGTEARGLCTDILADGSLNVLIDGKTVNVNYGEVSVRGIYGYI